MSEPELHQLRAAMDAINERLVDVLHERARLCRRIATWKRSHGQPAADLAREDAMLAALLRAAPDDGFGRDELATILRQVFATSRALVERSAR